MKRKLSIQSRLTIFTMLAFLLPLAAWMIFAFTMMNQRIYSLRISSAQNSLEHIGSAMRQIIDTCNIYANQISGNQDVLRLARSRNTDREVVEAYKLKLQPLVDSVRGQNPAIKTIHIVHDNETLFSVYDLLYRVADIEEYVRDIYRELPRAQEQNVQYYEVAPVHEYFEVNRPEEDCWYVYSVIRSTHSYQPYGIVEVVVDNQVLYAAMDRYIRSEGETLCLSREGKVIHGDALPPQDGEREEMETGMGWKDRRMTALTYPLDSMNAELVYTIQHNNISLTGTEIRMLAVLLVCSIISMLILTRLISRVIFRRLTSLSDEMDSISALSTAAVSRPAAGDEIDRLNEHFRQMLERMEQVSETEKQLIFNDLTNDLKPHFICNAMDMLQLQAERARQSDLACSARRISQYFRYSMLREKGVTLLSELDDANNYLGLVNSMRENKVCLDVELDEWSERNIEKLTVPKMILQPLVDNAVRHGIKGDGGGLIRIFIQQKEGNLYIKVEDNGVGMTPEQERQLRAAMAGFPQWTENRRHVGITNVIMRMNIFFSGQYTLDFKTIPDGGSVFTLTLLGVEKYLKKRE